MSRSLLSHTICLTPLRLKIVNRSKNETGQNHSELQLKRKIKEGLLLLVIIYLLKSRIKGFNLTCYMSFKNKTPTDSF